MHEALLHYCSSLELERYRVDTWWSAVAAMSAGSLSGLGHIQPEKGIPSRIGSRLAEGWPETPTRFGASCCGISGKFVSSSGVVYVIAQD